MTETFHHQFFWYCNLLRRHMLNQERIFPHIARHQFQETRACFITKHDRVSESQFFFRIWDGVCLCRSSTVSLHQSSTPRHGTTIFRKNSHHQQKDQQDQMNMKKLNEKVHSTEPERSPGFFNLSAFHAREESEISLRTEPNFGMWNGWFTARQGFNGC